MSLMQSVAQQVRRGTAVLSRPTKNTNHIVSQTTYPMGGYNENKAQMRKEATTQYYRDHDIHEAAKKKSVRLKATALLYTGKIPTEIDSIRTAQYLQTELPVRVAHRIKGFHDLPFVIVTNPRILGVMELYIRSFKIITSFNNGERLTTHDEVIAFENLLQVLLDDHSNVIEDLTQGFRDCHDHILEYCDHDGPEAAHEKASQLVQSFLDRTLTSRLGIRLLVQHHLLLSDQVEKKLA